MFTCTRVGVSCDQYPSSSLLKKILVVRQTKPELFSAMHLKLRDFGTIKQSRNLYGDVYVEKASLNPKNNPCGTLCYTFSPRDADRERHHGRTLCVGVCPVNAFSSVCMMHLLTAIRGDYTGEYEQN